MRLRPRLFHEVICPRYDEKGREIVPEDRPDALLVLIINRSKNGFLFKSPLRFTIGSLLQMRTRLSHGDVWVPSFGKVVRASDSPTDGHFYLLGVELDPKRQSEDSSMDRAPTEKRGVSSRDLEFLMGTKLFDALSDEAKCSLVNSMKQQHLEAGERFIRQGQEGATFFVVQEGSCVVKVEKGGTEHPVACRRTGDIVGEMALFTGGPRNAHVDAETDVTLWTITKTQFDALCEGCPDIQDFLTELITNRLSSERFTADKNVGKYVINNIIGRGGWSIVYKGMHKHLNMPVAIKMLKHDLAMDPVFSERFRYEAKTIAQFNHENIVKVYDIEELYRTIFIITEYLEGMSLDYILEKLPRLPLSRVMDILLQVCSGLSYAHGHGIVHQDIKPANIFIQPNDHVKIVDFGLACSPETTDTGLGGTIFYAAPETINGESVDERADIYSLGLTVFEMITGQRPFPEHDLTKMMESGLDKDVPDPRTLIPDLPDELCRFIQGATQRDPDARYKSIPQALLDLEFLARKMGIKRHPRLGEQGKMMRLFLFYQDQDEQGVKRLVENFRHELKEIGAELRAAEFTDE
jgi:CRP-like cAMP-binding protein/tRNA A-37 threonylcarbamoyl transferase component Bud32